MSLRLVLVVACAALLQVGCEARKPTRRSSWDASVSLGFVSGSNYTALPVLKINGPDVIIGFPEKCEDDTQELIGTLVIVSNNDHTLPPVLEAADLDNPSSNLAIHCAPINNLARRCVAGITVTAYQFCAPWLD